MQRMSKLTFTIIVPTCSLTRFVRRGQTQKVLDHHANIREQIRQRVRIYWENQCQDDDDAVREPVGVACGRRRTHLATLSSPLSLFWFALHRFYLHPKQECKNKPEKIKPECMRPPGSVKHLRLECLWHHRTLEMPRTRIFRQGRGLQTPQQVDVAANTQFHSSCEYGEGGIRFNLSLCHTFVQISQQYFAA